MTCIVETAKDPNGYWFVQVNGLMDCDIPYSNTEAECLALAAEEYPEDVVITSDDPRHYSNVRRNLPPETDRDREALREQIQREHQLQAWRDRGVL